MSMVHTFSTNYLLSPPTSTLVLSVSSGTNGKQVFGRSSDRCGGVALVLGWLGRRGQRHLCGRSLWRISVLCTYLVDLLFVCCDNTVVENQCTLVDRFLFVCCDNIVVPLVWRISLLYIWSIAWLSHSNIACLLSLWRNSLLYIWLIAWLSHPKIACLLA